MSALGLIHKIEALLKDDTLEKETVSLLKAAIEDTRQKGIEEDILSEWYSVPEICKRWQVGTPKVVAIRKKLGKGRRA